MNILDTLISNTICQFSSNFTNICFTETENIEIKPKMAVADIAKALYKLQYTLNKKFRALKYFVFVSLQESPKTTQATKQTQTPQQTIPILQSNLNKIIKLTESIYLDLKIYAFHKLVQYKNSCIFTATNQLLKIFPQHRLRMITNCFNQFKEIDKLYTKIDILIDVLISASSKVKLQNLKQAFECIHQESVSNIKIDISLNDLIQITEYQQEQNYQSEKLNQFKNLQDKLTQSKIQAPQSLASSINSVLSIDQLNHSATPTKTDKSGISKKKVHLSTKRNHSKSISLYRNQINIKPKQPFIFNIRFLPVEEIKVSLDIISAEHEYIQQNSSRPLRSLYPDQTSNDLGDIADNLNVFPWEVCNENLMRSARFSAFSLPPSQYSIPKKKQSVGSILTRSTKHNPNILPQKSLFQSSELKKVCQTNPNKSQFTTITKKIKSSCIQRKSKGLQRTGSDLYKTPQASYKLLSFLKNQNRNESSSYINPGSINKTLTCKTLNQQNRSKARNSFNIEASQKRTNQGQEVTILQPGHKQKVIRKFSPITIIRQRLMNSLK